MRKNNPPARLHGRSSRPAIGSSIAHNLKAHIIPSSRLQKSGNIEAIRLTISTAFLAHVLIFQKTWLGEVGPALEPFHRALGGDHKGLWQEPLRFQVAQDQTS